MWLSVAFIPIACFAVSIWFIDWAASAKGMETGWSITGAAISAASGVLSMVLLYQKRDRITKSIELVELAIRILAENPSLFGVSFGLILVFMIFNVVWLAMFGHIVTFGHLSDTVNGSGTFR